MKSDSEANPISRPEVRGATNPQYVYLKHEPLIGELHDKCVLIKGTAMDSFAPFYVRVESSDSLRCPMTARAVCAPS